MRPASIVILCTAAACGPDLAELEVEQQALEREVEVLSSDVHEMRAQLQAMGILPSAPDGAALGLPVDSLRGEIGYTVARGGEPPELPPLGEPERRAGTNCGWRFFSPWLESISDIALERTGSGKASPLVLSQGGEALMPHALPPKFEKECSGAFRVQPRYIFFSPRTADAVGGPWSLTVDEAIPLERGGDGRGMYWVFPGTALTFQFDRGWDASWGQLEVRLDARLLAVGVPEHPKRRPQAPAEVEVLGLRESALDNRLGVAITPEPPDASWSLTVRSPEGGPWVLLESLVIGNDDRSLVITAEDGA